MLLLLLMTFFMFVQFFETLSIGLMAALFQVLACCTNLSAVRRSLLSASSAPFNLHSLRVGVPNSLVWVVLALEF